MSIIAKLGLSRKRENPKARKNIPIQTYVRSRGFTHLYTFEDFLVDLIRHCTIKQRVYHPHIPKLVVEYVPIYSWTNPQLQRSRRQERDENIEDVMEVTLSHCNTIVINDHLKFGAVLGTKLDPRVDHIINVQLVDGVEFGVGICDSTQLNLTSRRDFMCMEGGYGYYNYKTKSARLKPKYPPGLYYKVQTCHKIRDEADICRVGDVLTMVVQRENIKSPGGGSNVRSRFGSERDLKVDPMLNLEATTKHTLSFYKNGEDMGFHLSNLKGPLYMCLNYYFVESKVKVLSDYNFRKKYHQRLRFQMRRASDRCSKKIPGECYKRSGGKKSNYVCLSNNI